MERTKTIHANDSDHGMSVPDISSRSEKALWRKKKFFAVGLVVLLAGWIIVMASVGGIETGLPVSSGAPQPTLKFTLIEARELKEWLDQGRTIALIDARSPGEFSAGHIAAAVNNPQGHSSSTSSQRQEPSAPIVFYCAASSESGYSPCARAIEQALRSGSREVYWFKGGMSAWLAQGYPVETSSLSNKRSEQK